MFSKLFAFNVAQEVPESEVVPFDGSYDPARQAWVAADGQLATSCCGSGHTTNETTGHPGGTYNNDQVTDWNSCDHLC